MELRRKLDILALISIGLALRASVSLYSYSGKNKPPIYGDYEAQRHWQEITVNLEPSEWYSNSSANDLLYWGLDYPPLTAYHSQLVGQVAKVLDEKYVQLHESRGFESRSHKTFMRFSVLVADLLVYIPAVVVLALVLEKTFQKEVCIACISLLVIYPGQILIDNGHFQYNNISLGFAALAIAGILANREYIAAFLFTLALNYKQMELYHALPIFFYLLRRCVFGCENYRQGLKKLFGIASIVLVTFFALWYPWLKDLNLTMGVIKRLFPISRGVFEDKVGNFWCALNVIYKIKNTSNEQMALICLLTTATVVLPMNVTLLSTNRKDKFLNALVNTALSFFLFSFQVHEKSILLATLPCVCLIALKPALTFLLLQSALFSMFPLFLKDGLIIPFYALVVLFSIAIRMLNESHVFANKIINKLYDVSTIVFFILSLFVWIAPVPEKYPYLWSLLIAMHSFANFVVCLLLGIYYQISYKNAAKTI